MDLTYSAGCKALWVVPKEMRCISWEQLKVVLVAQKGASHIPEGLCHLDLLGQIKHHKLMSTVMLSGSLYEENR